MHLVDFRVISRTGRGVEPYEAAGLKDVVWLGKNEVVKVEAHYAPWNGVYMFHCHNRAFLALLTLSSKSTLTISAPPSDP